MRPDGIGDDTYVQAYIKHQIVNGYNPTKHAPAVRNRYAKLKYGQQDKISKSPKLNPDGYCPTLRAGTGPEKGSYQAVRPIHYRYPRVITPREAARLQGFQIGINCLIQYGTVLDKLETAFPQLSQKESCWPSVKD